HGTRASRVERARRQEAQNLKRWGREAVLLRCMHRDVKAHGDARLDRFLEPLLSQADAFDTLARWWTFGWLKRLTLFPGQARSLSLSRMKLKFLLPSPVYLAARALTLKQ